MKGSAMSLEAAYIVPHPPLAVHEVGRGREAEIDATIEGYEEVARRIARIAPEKIVIISPHAAYYADWIYIAGGAGASGDLASFGAPQVRFDVRYDDALRSRIEDLAREHGIPAGIIPGRMQPLDHGTMVPLYYLEKEYPADSFDCILIGGSALPRGTLLEFGSCIADVCAADGAKCVLLVSGDLSHKLEATGPYGFDPAGPVFDKQFVDVVSNGDPLEFSRIDPQVCEDAAECGLSGFIMMAGALQRAQEIDGARFTSELISHEGPFGVGYGVAAFERNGAEAESAAGRNGEEATPSKKADCEGDAEGDPLVSLARQTIRDYVTSGEIPEAARPLPADLPKRAGCFVSIHAASTGDLRGCIGTISPVQDTLASEVVANAISASTRDPRFLPIGPDELDDLDINVDVLYPPEPSTLKEMDPERYGIIVEQGWKRGLLLPDLDGVDTVADQYRIACMKAGIDPDTPPDEVDIQRFEVERHR